MCQKSKKGLPLRSFYQENNVSTPRYFCQVCERIPTLSHPKRTGYSAPSVSCGATSHVPVAVVMGPTFVTNVSVLLPGLVIRFAGVFLGKTTKMPFFFLFGLFLYISVDVAQ